MRKKKKKLIVTLLVVVFLFFLSLTIILANSPDNPSPPPPLTNIGVCADAVNTTNPSQPVFSWTTSGNPQRYYWLMVDNNSNFSSPEINTGAVYSGAKSYQTSPGQLAQNQTYWWRVAVRDDYGWTGWASCTSFFLPSRPPSATNLQVSQPGCYPRGTSAQPTLSWTFSDPDAGDYQTAFQVQVDNNGDFSSPEVDSGKVLSGANSYTVPAGKLNYSTNYYWRVRVWDKYDINSDWANSSFTTAPLCNNPPSASNLQANLIDGCLGAYYRFSWTFSDPDGDSQSAYQVQVDNNSNFNSPEIDSGKIYSSSNSYAPTTQLSWNTRYYWRLKVWDSLDAESEWQEGPSFTTPKHRYPTVDFNWSPYQFSVGEIVLFADQSTVSGGVAKVSWYWTFESGLPDSSTQQNPSVKFTEIGSRRVTLRVTDSDGYSCQATKFTPAIRLPSPEWREIPPFLWLQKLLASLGEIFSQPHFISRLGSR